MKKWYCPNCKTFKRFKRTQTGFAGYDDTYHCRCCGTKMYNAKEILERAQEELVLDIIKDMEARKYPYVVTPTVEELEKGIVYTKHYDAK